MPEESENREVFIERENREAFISTRERTNSSYQFHSLICSKKNSAVEKSKLSNKTGTSLKNVYHDGL